LTTGRSEERKTEINDPGAGMSPSEISRSGEDLAKPWADFNETDAQLFYLDQQREKLPKKSKVTKIFKIDRGENHKV